MKRLPWSTYFVVIVFGVSWIVFCMGLAGATDINSLNPCLLLGPRPTAPSKQLHAPKPIPASKQPKVPPFPLPTMELQPFDLWPPPAGQPH